MMHYLKIIFSKNELFSSWETRNDSIMISKKDREGGKKKEKETKEKDQEIVVREKISRIRIDGELFPRVIDAPWVNPLKFSANKIVLGEEIKTNGVSRITLLYKYSKDEDAKLLVLVPIRDSEAYFRSNGTEDDVYVSKETGTRTVNSTRNIVKFYLDENNKHHEKFMNTLFQIKDEVQKRLEKEVSLRGCYDIINDNGDTTGYAVTSKIVESNEGVVYTSSYDDENQLDVKNLGKCTARPAITFSFVVPPKERENGKRKLNISLTQIYCKFNNIFPLRDRD